MSKANKDPYAPPPRYRDHTGALVRVVILAALLAVAVWGYTTFADQDQVVAQGPQEQQMAQSSYAPPPSMPTQPEPAAPGATPSQQPAPVQEPGQQTGAPEAQPPTSSPPATPPPAPTPR